MHRLSFLAIILASACLLDTAFAKNAPFFETCTVSNSFALTFDDGPFDLEHKVLDLLKSKKIKTTFFVNGNNFGCIYDFASVLQRAVSEGHQIAAHTWSHPDLTKVSNKEIDYQITALENALRKIIGRVPRYFRLPFGAGFDDSRVMGKLNSHGYRVIQWDIDSEDSLGASVGKSEKIYKSALAHHPSPAPHIALNHEWRTSTVTTLAPFVLKLAKSYNFMPVGACLNDPELNWYKEIVTPSKKDKTWKCSDSDIHINSGGFS